MHFVAATLFVEDCSVAPVAATVLSLALAALWLLVPDCLRQLLLLHGRGCRCPCLVVQNLLHLNICAVAMASYVCHSSVLSHHVERSFSTATSIKWPTPQDHGQSHVHTS